VIQQIHYWIVENKRRGHNLIDDRTWTYSSYEEWQDQFPFWSISTIRRTLTSLKNQGLIFIEQLSDDKFDHRNWYAIDYEKFGEQIDLFKMTTSKASSWDASNGSIWTDDNKETETTTDISPIAVMVNALCEVTQMSGHLNWGILSALGNELLEADYTAVDVLKVYGPGGYWQNADWRGKKGDLPNPKHVRETIKRGLTWEKKPKASQPAGKQAMLQELTRLITTYGRTRYTKAREEFTPELEKVIVRMGNWEAVCGLPEEQIKFKFYEAYNDV
jgi:hypothetical protein